VRSSLTPWSRFSALLSLLLHLMLVGAGPVIDARLEAEALASDHPPVHVEDAADPSCNIGHEHQVCLIRALQSMDAPPKDAPLRIALGFSPDRRSSVRIPAPAATTSSALGPRAPPAA
jgi:hypothetical protein